MAIGEVSLSDDLGRTSTLVTHSGLFHLRPCPSNCAPATFKRMMNCLLQGLHWSQCLVYMDGIISSDNGDDLVCDGDNPSEVI